ncbi:hypothetical protein V2J09_002766 [Rumex salicifolius]
MNLTLLQCRISRSLLLWIHCFRVFQEETQLALFEGLSLVGKEIRKVLDVLGLLSVLPYSEVSQELNYKGLARAKITEDYLLQQIKLRHGLRKVKSGAIYGLWALN